MGYLDNIMIYSRSEKEHLEHLEEIFSRLKAAGLKLKLEKCCFFKKHIQYLSHLILAEGIKPLPEKLESIAKMPAPKNPKEVKQFLGLVGYYRKFVPLFADISRVLTQLTKKDVEFKWTPECENCFQILNTQTPRQTTHYTQMHQNTCMPVYSPGTVTVQTTPSPVSVVYSDDHN